jgi:hypothetical protein
MRSLLLALALAVASGARAAEPAPVRLLVSPPTIELSGARDRQGVVVQAQLADGSTRDVTAAAEMRPSTSRSPRFRAGSSPPRPTAPRRSP